MELFNFSTFQLWDGTGTKDFDSTIFTHAHDGGWHAARGRAVVNDEISGKTHIGQRLRRIGCRLPAREIGRGDAQNAATC